MKISIIVAAAENDVIGRNGDLPWHLPDDMRFFKETTMGHPVIMGRKNWDSIPDKYRPLIGRPNLVLSRDEELKIDGASIHHSLTAAIDAAKEIGGDEAFIIGGGQIYAEALEKLTVDRIYMTRVHDAVNGSVRFPAIDQEIFQLVQQRFHARDPKHAHAFSIQRWERSDGSNLKSSKLS